MTRVTAKGTGAGLRRGAREQMPVPGPFLTQTAEPKGRAKEREKPAFAFRLLL